MAGGHRFDTLGRVSASTAALGDGRNIREETALQTGTRGRWWLSSKCTVSLSRVDCMHGEVARIFVGVERRIKTGKLSTIDTEPPHVGSWRPLRVPRHTHAAHRRQRHPTSRAVPTQCPGEIVALSLYPFFYRSFSSI